MNQDDMETLGKVVLITIIFFIVIGSIIGVMYELMKP